jgi:hypothetical protein
MAIDGMDKFTRRIAKIPKATREALRATLHEQANRVSTLAKALAPVDEGDLKDSVRVEVGRHDLAVDVLAGGEKTTKPVREGVTTPAFDYALEAEKASPFFYPAYRALKKSIRSKINRAVTKAAKGDVQ